MGEKTADIIRRLAEKGAETRAYFGGLRDDQWGQQVYTTGPAWDVRQVLCHFVSAESSFPRLFEAAMAGDRSVPDAFDIDAFNAREVAAMADLPPAELLTRFAAVRAGTIRFLEGIEDADLEREAWHPWFGWDKLDKFLKLVYRHNMLHERDVRRALESGQPVEPSE